MPIRRSGFPSKEAFAETVAYLRWIEETEEAQRHAAEELGKQAWVTFNGDVNATLPKPDKTVLIEGKVMGRDVRHCGSMYVGDAAIPCWFVQGKGFRLISVGDRWRYWPED